MKQNIDIVYLDMDGVLCDFETTFENLKGSHGLDGHQWENKYGKEEFWDFVNGQGINFWKDMLPITDMKILVAYVTTNFTKKQIGIMSSSSKNNGSIYAEAGKLEWLNSHGLINYINPQHLVIVPSAEIKKQYAKPDAILIDDYKKNVDSWVKNGGIGIKHESAESTIDELNQYVISRNLKEYV